MDSETEHLYLSPQLMSFCGLSPGSSSFCEPWFLLFGKEEQLYLQLPF